MVLEPTKKTYFNDPSRLEFDVKASPHNRSVQKTMYIYNIYIILQDPIHQS